MKPINCRNLTKDQRYIKEVLTKSFFKDRKTVAPDNNNGIGVYDFESINEALVWVKMTAVEIDAPTVFELVLGKGSHYLKDNDILQKNSSKYFTWSPFGLSF